MTGHRSRADGWARAATIGGSLALFALPAGAQTIPPLDDLSAAFAKAHADVAADRAKLAAERNGLRARNEALNAACSAVEEGSAQETTCLTTRTQIDAAVAAHILRTRQFNIIVDASLADPSVVDGRVVPWGADLPQVEELERSPAADRARKGLQAAANHDWKVALAWWQEALQRDPGNAALKRSVDLAQWMVDERTRKAANAAPFAEAVAAASRGDDAAALRLLQNTAAEHPELAGKAELMSGMLREYGRGRAETAGQSGNQMPPPSAAPVANVAPRAPTALTPQASLYMAAANELMSQSLTESLMGDEVKAAQLTRSAFTMLKLANASQP